MLGPSSPVLKKVEVDVLTPKECEYNLHLTGPLALTDNMFCAQQEGKSSYKRKWSLNILERERVENKFVKTSLSTLERDLNLDLSVIGSLVYCESSDLDHVATEVGDA
ncbi:unnamed protein product [Timema podura]|uniref:Uncharacterized protein n=1 Tax=Timema podura TaxID=61482 RepID=A0ABN7PL51_TIMPD|nr:unnamed protein product [Timema podura]